MKLSVRYADAIQLQSGGKRRGEIQERGGVEIECSFKKTVRRDMLAEGPHC